MRSSIWLAFLSAVPGLTAAPDITTSSFDGRVIGVCFNRLLDPASATDTANYSLDETNVIALQASLAPDQKSVLLILPHRVTGNYYVLSTSNIQDSAGNLITRTGLVGRVQTLNTVSIGVDSIEKGNAFTCEPGAAKIYSKGIGFMPSGDGFQFVFQQNTNAEVDLRGDLNHLEAPVAQAQAGLMMREDLNSLSPFIAVTARTSLTSGKYEYQAVRRETRNGPIVYWSDSVMNGGLPVEFRLKRSGKFFEAWFSTNRGEFVKIGSFGWTNVPSSQLYVGMFVAPGSNSAANWTTAEFSGYHEFLFDPERYPLTFERASTNLFLTWNFPERMLESSRIATAGDHWLTVTNAIITIKNGQARMLLPKSFETQRFYRVQSK